MSIFKEKIFGQSPDQPEKADEAKRDEVLARLKKKLRPEIFESYKDGVKRFHKLYKLLAK